MLPVGMGALSVGCLGLHVAGIAIRIHGYWV